LTIHPRPVEESYMVGMDLVSVEKNKAGMMDAIEKGNKYYLIRCNQKKILDLQENKAFVDEPLVQTLDYGNTFLK
jgi:hypothetical protein